MSGSPRVTAVVLSWNGRERTLACLRSLEHVTYRPFSVLVVDNGSSDGSADAVAAEHPDVSLVRLGENLGFAGGMNAGIRAAFAAGADAVVLLNNDMEVEPGFVEPLVAALDGRPVGALRPARRSCSPASRRASGTRARRSTRAAATTAARRLRAAAAPADGALRTRPIAPAAAR